MAIRAALILAAGAGTRMGEIGKFLPKVLWPVVCKSLLELQINFVREILSEEFPIYINLYYYREYFHDFRQIIHDKYKNIFFIEEETAIDSGGAIHNLARLIGYSGSLLTVNADCLILGVQAQLKKIVEIASQYQKPATLFSIVVDRQWGLNQIILKDKNYLGGIINFKEVNEQRYFTYSGISLLNLAQLKPCLGASQFFQSVAPFQQVDVEIIQLTDAEYWDFGTSKRYYESMKKIFQRPKSSMLEFLERYGCSTNVLYDQKYELEIELISHSLMTIKSSSEASIRYKQIIQII